MRFSGFFFLVTVMIELFPLIQSSPPAEAVRLFRARSLLSSGSHSVDKFSYRRAPRFRNADECALPKLGNSSVCNPYLVHVAITLDVEYLRGSIAVVFSVLRNSKCPESVFFHFLVSEIGLGTVVRSTFPGLKFRVYYFDPERVRKLISRSVRQALDQPLNYSRIYLADLLDHCVTRVIYLDSDLVVIDDISKLWRTRLGQRTIGVPQYCHVNFKTYFTKFFWSSSRYADVFSGRRPCYFNSGVMVIDLEKWRRFHYTRRLEGWMEVQKMSRRRIYELGSLPPYLLLFAGNVAPIEHMWNQHGLGGHNVHGSCRNLHPGLVSLLHWSGSGKPWRRLDSMQPCPLDWLWKPYDLYVRAA